MADSSYPFWLFGSDDVTLYVRVCYTYVNSPFNFLLFYVFLGAGSSRVYVVNFIYLLNVFTIYIYFYLVYMLVV
jgi:hypothetical protein